MTFRLNVKISVTNQDGDEVNHKGYTKISERKFFPLTTEQELSSYEDVEKAHAALNDLYRAIEAISKLSKNA